MEVVWNAVFYDSVAEYASAWRRRKLWTGSPLFCRPPDRCSDRVEKIADIPHETVSSQYDLVSHGAVNVNFLNVPLYHADM